MDCHRPHKPNHHGGFDSFLAGNFTYADAQTGPDIRLVLQITIDGLRADLINRFILPVIYSEGRDTPFPPGTGIDSDYAGIIELAQGSAFGLGDMAYQGFFGPARPGKWVWGVGPALVLPTATEGRYASDKWSAGASAVAL